MRSKRRPKHIRRGPGLLRVQQGYGDTETDWCSVLPLFLQREMDVKPFSPFVEKCATKYDERDAHLSNSQKIKGLESSMFLRCVRIDTFVFLATQKAASGMRILSV